MATYIPVTNIPTQFFDAAGLPLVSGTLEFYLAGTSTATDLFSDNAGTSIGTSITLNALGYPESGGNLIGLFRDQSKAIKIVSKDSADATIYTMDNIPAVASFDSASSAKLDFITVTQDVDLDAMETSIATIVPASGGTFTGDVTLGAYLNESVSVGLVASTTQTQGQLPITSGLNEFATVANANDTTTLPTAVAGRSVTIINNGVATLQIFPVASSYIDDLAINTPITLEPASKIMFKAYSATKWETVSVTFISTTAGDVLTSNGAGTTPTFQTPADISIPSYKSYSFKSRTTSNGVNYLAGFYEAPTADTTLSNASLTQTLGTALNPYAAHVFAVTGAAGTTDGSDMIITVSGTSITDAGVRTGTDSEVLIADCTAAATDQYFETTKKWVGIVTLTITSTAGSTFTIDLNYGLAKYEDFGNLDFTMTDFEAVGQAQATDTGFDISLLKHSSTGWTYSAAAFAPGSTPIAAMTTVHGTESDLTANKYFAFKRTGLTTAITGTAAEGVIVRVTTSVNNSIAYMDSHIGVVFT